MYFILPIWLLAGFADWLCHRAAHIETTTGVRNDASSSYVRRARSATAAAIFLQVNAGIIAFMIVAFFIHEATALWDVSYAVTARGGNAH